MGLALLLSTLALAACTREPAAQAPQTPAEHAEMRYDGARQEPARSPVELVRERHESELMAIDGVMGVGIGRTPAGQDAVVVYVMDASVASRLPKRIDGVDVEVVVTGLIEAQGAAH